MANRQAKKTTKPAPKRTAAEIAAAEKKAKADAAAAETTAKKTEVELEGLRLTNQKTQLDMLPEAKATPLDKGITVGEGVGLVAELMAHSLVERSAEMVSGAVTKAVDCPIKVLIVNDRSIADGDWIHKSLSADLPLATEYLNGYADALEEELGERAGEPDEVRTHGMRAYGVTGGLGEVAIGANVAKSLVGAAADIAGLFIPEYSIAKAEVSVEATPLLSALAGKLQAGKHQVGVESFTTLSGDSTLWGNYRDAVAARNKVDLLAARLEAKKAEEKARSNGGPPDQDPPTVILSAKELQGKMDGIFSSLTSKKDPCLPILPELRQALAEADPQADGGGEDEGEGDAPEQPKAKNELVAAARIAVASFDAFASRITSAEEDARPALLAALLHEELHDPERWTHVLYAGLDVTRGETITSKSRWRAPKLRYVAGCNASYMLFDLKERVVRTAGTFPLAGNLRFQLGKGPNAKPELLDLAPS
ncbi:MAG: hypothetical protein J0H98_03370 [Solirubrobacterales bacterium]|nr:hypothetical protein [Solirubrobacterales bacterium]